MMRDAGYTAIEMKKAGYDAKRINAAGYSAQEASDAGFTVPQMYAAGYAAGGLRKAGHTALVLREAVRSHHRPKHEPPSVTVPHRCPHATRKQPITHCSGRPDLTPHPHQSGSAGLRSERAPRSVLYGG